MRAREPDYEGTVERDGVRVGYDVYGTGEPTIVLLTSWAIVHARQWKAQVPYLARRFRVITVEGRGNGRADRPGTEEAYSDRELRRRRHSGAGRDRSGPGRGRRPVAGRPARAAAGGLVSGAGGRGGRDGTALPWPIPPDFFEPKDSYEGWEKANMHYWLADYRGWVEFFISQVFSEPHSIKQREDGVSWGLDTTPETLLLTGPAVAAPTEAEAEAICRLVRCPVLIMHGDQDAIVPYETGVAIARWTGGQMVTFHGGGHAPNGRDPVQANLLIRSFAESLGPRSPGPRTWTRGRDRRKRALYVSSPIGLGLFAGTWPSPTNCGPGTRTGDRLAHPAPGDQVLEERGERVHPASRWLASESAHIESEAGEHNLNVFQAARRMDEILIANFMVFHDLTADEPYDLWIADEGWDVDYFLFDNPELKRTAYAWLTDFTGWLPMPDGGAAEAALTADWNADGIERMRRYPRLRDRSIFVGNPGDLVDAPLGPGLPSVRDWTLERYACTGYVTGFTPPDDREALRAELGYRPGERVCLVTVGGSGVGGHLLHRVASAYPLAEKRVPGLRMIAVTGPRIDPGRSRCPTASKYAATCPTCTGIWPRATWRWSRAG